MQTLGTMKRCPQLKKNYSANEIKLPTYSFVIWTKVSTEATKRHKTKG